MKVGFFIFIKLKLTKISLFFLFPHKRIDHSSLIVPADAVACWLKTQAGGKNSRRSVRVGESTMVVWVTDGGGEEEKEEKEEEREEGGAERAGGGRASGPINQDGRSIRSETFRRCSRRGPD